MFKEFRKQESPIEKIRNVIIDELRYFGFTPGEITIEDKELSFSVAASSDQEVNQRITQNLYNALVIGKNKLAADVFVLPTSEADYEIIVKLL
jgi:hypothetical protein